MNGRMNGRMNTKDEAGYDEFAFLEQYAKHEGIPWRGRPAVERRSVRLDSGQTISALVWGDGEPEFVLLHGGGQNAHTWDSVAMALGRPLVAIDLPGHGHSSWRDDGDYRPSTTADAIAAAMNQLAPRADTVVGMSLGGVTAISLAARYPGLVPRLVVVDITPGGSTRRDALTAEQRGAVALVSGPPVFDSFEEMLQTTAAAVPGRPIETLRPGVLHNSRQREDGRWIWRYDRERQPATAADHEVRWDELSATTAPVMLVKGGNSPFVHDDDRDEFRRRRTDTRYEVVEGAHHSVQSDRPIRLAELIIDFRRT
jgi:pimeloyl-ACP methyl ester carboxylesterase